MRASRSTLSLLSSRKQSLAALTTTSLSLAILFNLSASAVNDDDDEDSKCNSSNNWDNNQPSQPFILQPAILATSDASADQSSFHSALRQMNSGNQSSTLMSPIDNYPSFTPHHNSLLKKYLNRPLWNRLSPLQTSLGTTLEDMIAPGLSLPLGAHPPRHIGLLAGDAECYSLFEEILIPIVEEYHGVKLEDEQWEDPELPNEDHFSKRRHFAHLERLETTENPVENEEKGVIKSSSDQDDDNEDFIEDDCMEYTESDAATVALLSSRATKSKANLRRHSTIINNPLLVTSQQADPEGRYILSTRIRIARSLEGVRFPPTMTRIERRHVQSLLQECCNNFHSEKFQGVFMPVLEMSTDQNLDLIERHLLFDNPNEWTIAAGLGRDWPDGRALYANVPNLATSTPDFMIWINEEDHLRISVLRPGGDIQGVFTTLMAGVRELERELRARGYEFAFHPKLGYLTSCPTNVGKFFVPYSKV